MSITLMYFSTTKMVFSAPEEKRQNDDEAGERNDDEKLGLFIEKFLVFEYEEVK